LIDGIDSTISVAKTPNIISTSNTLIAINKRLKKVSHFSWPLERLNLLFSTIYNLFE